MKRVLLSLYLALAITTTSTALADSVGNGADAVEIGGAIQVFDQVEFAEPLLPEATGAPWTIVSRQLATLQEKTPFTAAYLDRFFRNGTTVWWLVDATLRDVADEGASNLAITVDRRQVAINSGGVIQIQAAIWARLDDEGKATLLMHEMLWSAISQPYLGQGSNVRLLSRFLLNPNLVGFTPINVASFVKRIVADDRSPLVAWVDYDVLSAQNTSPFTVRRVVTGLADHLVGKIASGSDLAGLEFTVARPNATLAGLQVCSLNVSECFQEGRWIEPGLSSPSVHGVWERVDLANICGTLVYAGSGGWRLPSNRELTELLRLGFQNLRFGPDALIADPFARRQPNAQGPEEVIMAFLNNEGALTPTRYVFGRNVPYVCVR